MSFTQYFKISIAHAHTMDIRDMNITHQGEKGCLCMCASVHAQGEGQISQVV